MISQKHPTNYIEEQNLIKNLIKGDKRSLYFFWQKYSPKIWAYLKNKVREEKDAEELLQDIFLAGLEGLRDFRGKCSLYTYLYSIARYKVIDYYRKKKVAQIIFSKFPGLESLAGEILSPEEGVVKKELAQKVKKVFTKIKPIQAKLIYLKYEKGLTIKEIAKEIGTTIKTVESRLFRARLAFIKVFNEEEQNSKTVVKKTKRNRLSPS